MQHINSLLSVGKDWSVEPLDHGSGSGRQHTLRVVTVHDPLILSVETSPNGTHEYSGYLYEIWQILAQRLGLRYQLVPMSANDYGTLDANGTWTGLVGELVYGRADVALASLDMTSDRAAVIDFLDACPVDQSNSGFYVRRSPREDLGLLRLFGLLLKPLDTDLWWAVLGSLLLLSVILRISLHFNRGRAESQQTVDEMPWTTCLFSCYMSMVGQGWSSMPNSLAARAVTFICWILRIIIYAGYTANMISHCTTMTEKPPLPINSLEEFSQHPDWKLAMTPGSAFLNNWKSSPNIHLQALHKRYLDGEGLVDLNYSSKDSMRLVTQERLLTFADFEYIAAALGRDTCLLVPLPDTPVNSRFTFMAVAKRMSGLREEINQLLLKMKTSGLISGLKNRWVKPSDMICESRKSFHRVSFSQAVPILVIVPLAIHVSWLLCAVETVLSSVGAYRQSS